MDPMSATAGAPEGHPRVTSYLAVPVTLGSGEVLSGLFFGNSATGVFTEAHERRLAGLAAQAAIAMDDARLLQAVQSASESLERRVLERSHELTQAHETLRQAKKMETVAQFTGGIAHDFSNLLMGITKPFEVAELAARVGEIITG
jgi:GAF domain-containing protein